MDGCEPCRAVFSECGLKARSTQHAGAQVMPKSQLANCGEVTGRSRAGQGWGLPQPVVRFGQKLTEQQLWCWGRDIDFANGNLLVEYGFDQCRDTAQVDGSTCYRLDHDRFHVALWGFGAFFGSRDVGGLFFDRFEFRPKWAPIESLSHAIHWPADLPAFERPQGRLQWQWAHQLWKLATGWIATYETWVRRAVGLEYRRECVATWLRPFVRADKVSAAWRFLGQRGWEKPDLPISAALKRYTLQQV